MRNCSNCRYHGHTKVACPLLHKVCSICKEPGHNRSKCTYNALYDTVTCLPKDIITMIHGLKCSYDEVESRKSYFKKVVTKQLLSYKVETDITLITDTFTRYIDVDNGFVTTKSRFINVLDYIVDRKYVFDKLFKAFPAMKSTIIYRLIELHRSKTVPNIELYSTLIFGTNLV